MIAELDLLKETECSEIRTLVHDLRHSWIQRYQTYPFYTLATASYLDAAWPHAFQYYCQKAETTNQFLSPPLESIHSRIESVLEAHLGAPVRRHEQYALPGFHIFLAHDIFRQSVASIHCDLQHQLLDWGPPEYVDWEHPLSFTISISLPKSGAGLNIWNVHHDELTGLSKFEREALFQTREKQFVRYRTGGMVLHSGLSVHQIAPMPDAQPGEERITLQGHAILAQGIWQVYW